MLNNQKLEKKIAESDLSKVFVYRSAGSFMKVIYCMIHRSHEDLVWYFDKEDDFIILELPNHI